MIELHPLTVPTTCAELIEQLRSGAERATSDAPKSAKDLAQAAALIAAHAALHGDDDIAEAWWKPWPAAAAGIRAASDRIEPLRGSADGT